MSNQLAMPEVRITLLPDGRVGVQANCEEDGLIMEIILKAALVLNCKSYRAQTPKPSIIIPEGPLDLG